MAKAPKHTTELADDWARSRARWLSGETDASGAIRTTPAFPAPSPPSPSSPPAAPKDHATPAVDIARRILKELYPGLIPGKIPVKTLVGKIEQHVGPDEKPPRWDAVNEARSLHNQAVRSR